MNEEKKSFISPELLKHFKTAADVENYLGEVYKEAVQHMLKAEMDEHLGYEKHQPEGRNSGNSRNGFSKKTLKTTAGDIDVSVPRDRNASFEPIVVPKHERMSHKIETAVIGMYSRGMNTRDIEDQIKEIYGVDLSETSVSNITNTLHESIKQWQDRPLDSVYYILWMDGISVKIRHNGKIVNKTIFIVIGLNKEGKKEVLGMWVNPTESAAFWLTVLTDLKVRGVEDVLIACTDNLTGFTSAIKSTYPNAITQLCVVHQIRNSMRYVVWKDKKEFVTDLKSVYGATNRKLAEDALTVFEKKWADKYFYAVKSWKENWDNLTSYFDFPAEIRQIIYTTNVIESLNSGIRKYTKTKIIFPDDLAAIKAVYLAITNIQKKWSMSVRNWGLILSQFLIIFEKRCQC